MRANLLRTNFGGFLIVASILICSQSVSAQAGCLTADDVKRMLVQVNSQQNVSLNKKLRNELLRLKENSQKSLENTIDENQKGDALMKRIRASREKSTTQLCPILK